MVVHTLLPLHDLMALVQSQKVIAGKKTFFHNSNVNIAEVIVIFALTRL